MVFDSEKFCERVQRFKTGSPQGNIQRTLSKYPYLMRVATPRSTANHTRVRRTDRQSDVKRTELLTAERSEDYEIVSKVSTGVS